jgi:hypothetical protein
MLAASRRDITMLPASPYLHDGTEIGERLRAAPEATTTIFREIMEATCRRFPSLGQSAKTARIERLLAADALTEAALALIDLELPQWQVRRIAYDGGEWYCALSRDRELPDWLDQSVQAHHQDLALAILAAFVEAQALTTPLSQPSVPTVRHETRATYVAASCGNFA